MLDSVSQSQRLFVENGEPAVWVSNPSGLISLVIYLSMTCIQAHLILSLTSIQSPQSCCPLFGLFFADQSLELSTDFCL